VPSEPVWLPPEELLFTLTERRCVFQIAHMSEGTASWCRLANLPEILTGASRTIAHYVARATQIAGQIEHASVSGVTAGQVPIRRAVLSVQLSGDSWQYTIAFRFGRTAVAFPSSWIRAIASHRVAHVNRLAPDEADILRHLTHVGPHDPLAQTILPLVDRDARES
jgi:hypothetical protein